MNFKDAKYFGVKLSEHRIKNDKGQLIVTGCTFARTGKQKYHSSELGLKDDKFIYLDRPYEEVKDPKTVASFEGAPVTEDHPEDDVKVGVNWDDLAKGIATNVKFVDDIPNKEGHLEADFIFTDADLIKKIENNEVKELSAGYNCDVDEKDWVQKHIRGNHIAVVAQARAGHSACLRDKEYKSTSKSLKTLKIGDSVVKIADSYSYELNEDGQTVTYTDYYTESPSGKKKFLITLKDEEVNKGISKEELKSKLAKEFDANVDFNGISYLTIRYKKPVRTNATTQQKNYSKLKSILDNLGVKYDESVKVSNKSNSWGMQIYLDGYFNKEGIFVADSKKVKDSDDFVLDEDDKEIYTRRQDIDDNLKKVFSDTCFDVEGFMNGNDSTEGSIYVVDINPWLSDECYNYVEDNYEEDFDEEYLDLACEYFEKEINKRLQKAKLYEYGNDPYISSIDVDVVDWSGEEEFPIDVHIYCKNVTK